MPWSLPNSRAAASLRDEILARIEKGAFSYADYFPASKNAARFGQLKKKIPTFGELAKDWLDGHSHIADSTRQGYASILNRFWLPALKNKPITEVTGREMRTLAGKLGASEKSRLSGKDELSMTTRNGALSIVRMVFELAVEDELIPSNPAMRAKPGKTQKSPPDPLSLDEINKVLAYMQKHYPAGVFNYFEFAAFAGLRTSELIALPWSNVDFNSGLVRVDRAMVRKKLKKTKTAKIRDVELNSRALSALLRQKEQTFLAGGEVFLDPRTGKPFVNDQPPAQLWNRALKAVGVRHRKAYATRHTSVTLALMSGANPNWVAQQHGHTVRMTLEVYGKWIPGDDDGRELKRVDSLLAGSAGSHVRVFSPETAPKPGTAKSK